MEPFSCWVLNVKTLKIHTHYTTMLYSEKKLFPEDLKQWLSDLFFILCIDFLYLFMKTFKHLCYIFGYKDKSLRTLEVMIINYQVITYIIYIIYVYTYIRTLWFNFYLVFLYYGTYICFYLFFKNLLSCIVSSKALNYRHYIKTINLNVIMKFSDYKLNIVYLNIVPIPI